MDPEQPPSYDTICSPPVNFLNSLACPPVTTNEAGGRVNPEQCPTLVLDGCLIYSRLNQDCTLYEVSNPPGEASACIYGVEKIRYTISEANGETQLRSRRDHIYDFRSDYFSLGMRDVSVIGKRNRKHVFPKVSMSRRFSSSAFTIPGYFRTEQTMKNRIQGGSEIIWKDTGGKVIAVETKVGRSEEGKVREPPRLEVKEALKEKELDLLVTCWCARVWKQAKDEVSEPLTWEKFKRRVENHPRARSGWAGLS